MVNNNNNNNNNKEAVEAVETVHLSEGENDVVMTLSHLKWSSKKKQTKIEGVVKREASTTSSSSPENDSTKEEEEEEVEKNDEYIKDDARERCFSVRIRRNSMILINTQTNKEYDLAHKFKEHSYRSPTHCEICTGLLVGLWSQGLQCEACGLNVHRGGGINGHDDCHSEAMFTPCPAGGIDTPTSPSSITSSSASASADLSPSSSKDEEEKKSLGQAVKELTQLAKNEPNFFADIRAQMDRDVMNHVANKIITSAVEGEKSKKFSRAKTRIVPFLEYIDSIAIRGKLYTLYRLVRIHVMVDLVAAAGGFVLCTIAILTRYQEPFLTMTLHLALIHDSTVLVTVHVALLLLAFTIRYFASLFERKAVLIDQLLVNKFTIDAKEDLGVSVLGAARRALWWSDRVVESAAITCYASMIFWWVTQPWFETLVVLSKPPAQPTCRALDDMEVTDAV